MSLKIDGSSGLTFPDSSMQSKSAQGPAFIAYQNAPQTLATGSYTKLSLQVKEQDVTNAFSSGTVVSNTDTTNRFQPTVAGYYSLSGSVGFASSISNITCGIHKNGVEFRRGAQVTGFLANVSALVYLNGTTDYVELLGFQASGASVNTTGVQIAVYFSGFLARAA